MKYSVYCDKTRVKMKLPRAVAIQYAKDHPELNLHFVCINSGDSYTLKELESYVEDQPTGHTDDLFEASTSGDSIPEDTAGELPESTWSGTLHSSVRDFKWD